MVIDKFQFMMAFLCNPTLTDSLRRASGVHGGFRRQVPVPVIVSMNVMYDDETHCKSIPLEFKNNQPLIITNRIPLETDELLLMSTQASGSEEHDNIGERDQHPSASLRHPRFENTAVHTAAFSIDEHRSQGSRQFDNRQLKSQVSRNTSRQHSLGDSGKSSHVDNTASHLSSDHMEMSRLDPSPLTNEVLVTVNSADCHKVEGGQPMVMDTSLFLSCVVNTCFFQELFCLVTYKGHERRTQVIETLGRNTVWDETFKFPVSPSDHTLK